VSSHGYRHLRRYQRAFRMPIALNSTQHTPRVTCHRSDDHCRTGIAAAKPKSMTLLCTRYLPTGIDIYISNEKSY
ncbi:hypothetical protein, partial [Candidatus Anaplasma sp. TIGMIC]|uniref:hypothetical protein n=1 Tax=Candidatus Anaplasma sp. TIGMIC TaxID=3020713 RepID=UPI00232CFE1B